jgi:hypothetical protein
MEILPAAAARTADVPHSSCECLDEATNRWHVRVVVSRRKDLGTVEATLIDLDGDQTRWSYRDATLDGQAVA